MEKAWLDEESSNKRNNRMLRNNPNRGHDTSGVNFFARIEDQSGMGTENTITLPIVGVVPMAQAVAAGAVLGFLYHKGYLNNLLRKVGIK